MSHQAKVSPAPKTICYPNMLCRIPHAFSTDEVNSHGPETNQVLKKKSLQSISRIPKIQTSFDEDTEQRNRLIKAKNDILALERKLQRKCFFEQVCGPKVLRMDTLSAELPNPKYNKHTRTARIESANTAEAYCQDTKANANRYSAEPKYCSTSTVDSSYLSIEEDAKPSKTCFENLNIKKQSLTKNTNSKLEFIQLTNNCIKQNLTIVSKKLSDSISPSILRDEIAELAGDFNQWDSEMVDLDEKDLSFMFAKGFQQQC